MTDEKLADWRRVCEAATKGPCVEKRWVCPYCNTFYAEYINGCPRCYMGETGTSTSVVVVLAVRSGDKWEIASQNDAIRELDRLTAIFRTAVPELLAALAERDAEVERLRGLCGEAAEKLHIVARTDGFDCCDGWRHKISHHMDDCIVTRLRAASQPPMAAATTNPMFNEGEPR